MMYYIPAMVEITTLSGIKYSGVIETFEDLPYLNKGTLGTLLNKDGEALNYWIKRLTEKGDLLPLKRGLFANRYFILKLKAHPQLFDEYREFIAQLMRQPSYISLEYALAKYGVITDVPFSITSVTSKTSRAFTNSIGTFIYRSVKQSVFTGYTEKYFLDKRYFIATAAKALFDLVYLKKFENFEKELLDDMRINWDMFKPADLKQLKEFAKLAGKKKMDQFIEIIIKEGLI